MRGGKTKRAQGINEQMNKGMEGQKYEQNKRIDEEKKTG